jgi:CheY-like chemotaxis protein
VDPIPILVVDDNPQNLKLTRIVLAHEGHTVCTAANAEQAIEALAGFTPAVILMDLQMPGMDGFELTRRLKADPKTRSITIIALTAYAMKGDEERALAAGCDGYIAKPVDTRTLNETIARHVSGASAPPADR